MNMQHGHMQHGHASWTSRMDMQHRQAAWALSMDIEYGYVAWRHEHGARAQTCRANMNMQHGRGYAAWTRASSMDMDIKIQHWHWPAARTWTCSVGMDNQHGNINAVWTCSMTWLWVLQHGDMNTQHGHGHALCPCPVLHVLSSRPVWRSPLFIYADRPETLVPVGVYTAGWVHLPLILSDSNRDDCKKVPSHVARSRIWLPRRPIGERKAWHHAATIVGSSVPSLGKS